MLLQDERLSTPRGPALDKNSEPSLLRVGAGSRRLESVDALRGAAALLVVVHHAVNAGDTPPTSARWFPAVSRVAELGRLGVPLFFVLSGFCIHANWARGRTEGRSALPDFTKFWKRRVFRLYPPYLVALVLSMGAMVGAWALDSSLSAVTQYPLPRLHWMGMDFLAHLTMLHGFFPRFDRAGGNPPFWTLAREEYFYLMYFPLLFCRRRWGLALCVAAVFALGLVFPAVLLPRCVEGTGWRGIMNSSAVTLWIQWCLGMVAAEVHFGLARLPTPLRSPVLVPLLGVGAYAAQTLLPLLAPVMWGVTFFTLLNACLGAERERRWPTGRVVRWLAGVGGFSYSLYLVHHPVRGVLKLILASLITGGSPVGYALAIAIIVLGGYLAGKLFFHAVEKRFLRATSERAAHGLGIANALSSG